MEASAMPAAQPTSSYGERKGAGGGEKAAVILLSLGIAGHVSAHGPGVPAKFEGGIGVDLVSDHLSAREPKSNIRVSSSSLAKRRTI
jgi:hypothetical protein